MPRLAARGSALHPKATALWQNMLNEPSQQEKRGAGLCVCMHVCVCVGVCVILNAEKEVDGERIREGSGGVRWPFNLESLM